MAVIKQEDYIPSALTRGLNLNSMKIIGILRTDTTDTFYAKAVSLVEGLLHQNRSDMPLCHTGSGLEDKKKYLELLLAKRVDAVILTGFAFKENIDNNHIGNVAKQVPVIIINGLVELPGTYCVIRDEQSAMAQNVTLLSCQKRRDILHLYDILVCNGCFKLSGYRAGMKQCGLSVNENLIIQVPKPTDKVKRRVSSPFESGVSFSAVMVSENLLAIGAVKALREFGRSAPVVDFNNSILSKCCSPSPASVDNMFDTSCPAAISMLTGILKGESISQRMVILVTLVQRDTFRTDLQ